MIPKKQAQRSMSLSLPKVSYGINEKSVEPQCYELQNISYKIIKNGMCLDEQFQIYFIIDKLPLLGSF